MPAFCHESGIVLVTCVNRSSRTDLVLYFFFNAPFSFCFFLSPDIILASFESFVVCLLDVLKKRPCHFNKSVLGGCRHGWLNGNAHSNSSDLHYFSRSQTVGHVYIARTRKKADEPLSAKVTMTPREKACQDWTALFR